MEIKCPQCASVNWLENQSRCLQCSAILRRCVDCASYDPGRQSCLDLDTEIGLHEAERPSLLSISTNCARYRYLGSRP